MDEHEKMEFWSSLARLYDEILALRGVAELHQKAMQNLQISCEALRDAALDRGKRVVRLEVIQQWLAEKERNRELGRQ